MRVARPVWKHAPSVYRRHTLAHPTHVLAVALPAVIGAFTFDIAGVLIALGVAELFVIAQVPRLGWMRRRIDERIEQRVRSAASRLRARLLDRMSEEHQRELLDLETVAAAIRERCGLDGDEDDGLGVERLIELYVRFAVAHRATATLLDTVGRARPGEQLAQLEREAEAGGDLVRASINARIDILRMRCEARRAAHDQQTAIRHELAAIADTLRWMLEHCASASPETLRGELEVALAARERDAVTLTELCAMHDDSFEADVIPLGREPAAEGSRGPRLRVAGAACPDAEDDLATVGHQLRFLAQRA